MKCIRLLLSLFVISIIGCSSGSTLNEEVNKDYIRYKAKFDKSLISQFPENLTSIINSTIAYTNVEKHKVGLVLYEYELLLDKIDSVYNSSAVTKAIVSYASFDSCLLIVNRFETKTTAEKGVIPLSADSIIERKCFDNLYPIPNFVDYKNSNVTACGLDSTFVIFVIDAKKGREYSEKYNLKPFKQMPKEWENGYSKGIAISKQQRTVIYWSIMW